MFKRGLWRICWGLGAVFKAGSDFVAFVAKRQECLDKASPFYFFPGCVRGGIHELSRSNGCRGFNVKRPTKRPTDEKKKTNGFFACGVARFSGYATQELA